jgi:hypothetical protein
VGVEGGGEMRGHPLGERAGLQTESDMASTLHVLDKRDSTYAQIEKDTKPNSPERERKKLYAVLDMLEETGWLQTEQANTWHAYSEAHPDLSVEALRKDRNYIWAKTVGVNITWFNSALKAKGIK